MEVIKNINNNVARCLDSQGREVVVFGKGVGFFKPGEMIPLDRINRTFYNIKDTDFAILRNIPTKIINAAIYILDYASEQLHVTFPSSASLAFADHLQFAIERRDQNITLEMPLVQDLNMLYAKEMQVARKCLEFLEEMIQEKLDEKEAGILALHFINDRIQIEDSSKIDTSGAIEDCSDIIERHFGVQLDRDSFNYSRFVTHLDYLIRRLLSHEQIESKNREIFDQLCRQYPDTLACVKEIGAYLRQPFGMELSEEEMLYLMMHINRLISRMEQE